MSDKLYKERGKGLYVAFSMRDFSSVSINAINLIKAAARNAYNMCRGCLRRRAPFHFLNFNDDSTIKN